MAENSDTITGEVRGTPYYISPEQARGEKADERSDIYALGIMLYEMLSGRKPYLGDTTYAILEQHTSADLPQLPEALHLYQPLVDKLLAKQPAQRLASARELMETVEALRATVPEQSLTQISATS
jgi:serine/threonine protein kinase